MRSIRLLTLLGIGLVVAPYAHAQAGGQVDPGYNPDYQEIRATGIQVTRIRIHVNATTRIRGYPQSRSVLWGTRLLGIRLRIPGATSGVPLRLLPHYPYACAPYGYYGPSWFVDGVFIGVGPWWAGVDAATTGLDGGRYGGRGYYRGGQAFSGRGGFRGGGGYGYPVAGVPHGGGRSFSGGGRAFGGGGRSFRGDGHSFRGGGRSFRGDGHAFGGVGHGHGGGGGRAVPMVVGAGRIRHNSNFSRPTAFAVGRLVGRYRLRVRERI